MRPVSSKGPWKEKRLNTSSFCPQGALAKKVPSLALGRCISEPELTRATGSNSGYNQGVARSEWV